MTFATYTLGHNIGLGPSTDKRHAAHQCHITPCRALLTAVLRRLRQAAAAGADASPPSTEASGSSPGGRRRPACVLRGGRRASQEVARSLARAARPAARKGAPRPRPRPLWRSEPPNAPTRCERQSSQSVRTAAAPPPTGTPHRACQSAEAEGAARRAAASLSSSRRASESFRRSRGTPRVPPRAAPRDRRAMQRRGAARERPARDQTE